MKTSTYVIGLFVLLGLGLYLSMEYEKTKYSDEVKDFQCSRTTYLPFPHKYRSGSRKLTHDEIESLDHQLDDGWLSWTDKDLIGLPNTIFDDYPCIKHIDLSNNDFKNIPRAIQGLPRLYSFRFNNNDLDVFYFKSTGSSVKKIDLRWNKISKVVGSPKASMYIDEINLHGNEIETFGISQNGLNNPNNFAEIGILNLSDNQIKEFPQVFYEDLDVKEIDLTGNSLSGTVLLSGMRGCEILDLSAQKGSGLHTLIIDEEAFYKLKELRVGGTRLNKIEVKKHAYLPKKVLLGTNEIREFPNDLIETHGVEELSLYNNLIEIVEIEDENSSLRMLNLSNNKIKTIRYLKYLPKLKILNLNNNQLDTIPIDINYLGNLIEFHFSGNSLKTLPVRFTLPQSIRMLDLSKNQLSGQFFMNNNFQNIEDLNLSKNDIEVFTLANQIKNLNSIDLSYNQNLKKIGNEVFSLKSHLRKLILVGCTSLDEATKRALREKGNQFGVRIIFEEKYMEDH